MGKMLASSPREEDAFYYQAPTREPQMRTANSGNEKRYPQPAEVNGLGPETASKVGKRPQNPG